MIDLQVEIVTFNAAEEAAVDQLFQDMVDPARTPGTSWTLKQNTIARRIGGVEEIRHRPLGAQGNVMAGSTLAQILVDEDREPDYIVFYGCAGAADGTLLRSAFLVESTSYVSLGKVTRAPKSPSLAPLRTGLGMLLDIADETERTRSSSGATANPRGPLKVAWPEERVTLKNKWLCETNSTEVKPLAWIAFDQVLRQFVNLPEATGLDSAHVAATEKVVTVQPGPLPQPKIALPTALYEEGEWTYGEALAFVQRRCHPLPLLIEMESYGIGRTTEVLFLHDRVVVLRIVTDALANKHALGSSQEDILKQGLPALALLVAAMIHAARGI